MWNTYEKYEQRKLRPACIGSYLLNCYIAGEKCVANVGKKTPKLNKNKQTKQNKTCPLLNLPRYNFVLTLFQNEFDFFFLFLD